MKKIIRLTESDLTRLVRRVIKENEAPERYVIDVETGDMVGTHKYGVGFVVNKIGERMGYESDPTSIPDGTKMEKSDHELGMKRNYRNELGMDRDDFSSLRNIEEDNDEDDDDGEKFRYGPEHAINTLNSDVKKFIISKDLDKEESFRRLDQLIQQRIKPVLDKVKETGYWTDEEIDYVIRYLKNAYNYDYSSGKELPPPNYRY
jgi:hypothetical protein